MSGTGGGPLSDYGRSLFAVEIAQRPFGSKVSDEVLGERSGFFGRQSQNSKVPSQIKPYLKLRHLWMSSNLEKKQTVWRSIPMQQAFGVTFFIDEEGKNIFPFSFGYLKTITIFVIRR